METKYGSVTFLATTGTTLRADFAALKVFGVEYRGSVALEDYGQGFELRRDYADRPPSTWYAVSARRSNLSEASRPAQKAIGAAVVAAAAEWLKSNPAATDDAARREAERDLERAAAKVAELEAELVQARAAKARAALALKRLGGE